MIPQCAYPNTQAAATNMHRWLRHGQPMGRLTARPYNRHDPVNTDWWLIPSTDRQAYRYRKCDFRLCRDRLDNPLMEKYGGTSKKRTTSKDANL
jgi:hypothetical protein